MPNTARWRWSPLAAALLLQACTASHPGGGTADTTPPTVPQNLDAAAAGPGRIDLTWAASADPGGTGVSGYRLYRDGSLIASPTTPGHADLAVAPATSYVYEVSALDGATPPNESARSAPRTVRTPAIPDTTPPTVPASFTAAAAGSGRVDLGWNASTDPGGSGVSGYRLYRDGAVLAEPIATAYVDLAVAQATTYVYEVSALDAATPPNESARSPSRTVTTPAAADTTPPTVPADLAATASGTSEIRLTWSPSTDAGGAGLAGYRVYRDGASTPIASVPAPAYADPGLSPGTAHAYRVTAYDAATPPNESAPSTVAQATTASAPAPGLDARPSNPTCVAPARPIPGGTVTTQRVFPGLTFSSPVALLQAPGDPSRWFVVEQGGTVRAFANQASVAASSVFVTLPGVTSGGEMGLPGLAGRYLFGDFGSGRIWMADPQGGLAPIALAATNHAIASFGEGADGELYVVDYSGTLHALLPGTVGGGSIPASLADTGCVLPTDPTRPAPGLIPYAPGAALWSDGATKERWIALPDGLSIDTSSPSGDWDLPSGTVLMKSFRLGAQLIETRLLMRHPDGVWAGYTYEWNDAQTAATLVSGGKRRQLPGQSWSYPSEAQCLVCHTAAAGRSLSLETAQLNRNLLYPQTGRTANQVATLNAIGTLAPPIAADPAALPAYPDPHGTAGSLADRARAYLHANCSNCHRPGGSTPVPMDLRFATALASTAACNAVPQAGDLGLGAGARLVVPGNPDQSVLVARMGRRDAAGMPPLGSTVVDQAGVALLRQWIAGLAGCN